jgi:uncharacterized membrane protein YebE (DUF533 family)
MSLVSTLAKVAIGIAVAKGVSHLAKNGLGGGHAGGSPGRGTPTGDTFSPRTGGAGGGLSDMMGDILGGGRSNGRTASTQSRDGGLGGMFDQLPDAATKKSSGKNTRANAPSSVEDLLGGGSGRASGGGSLGDLLGGMLGSASAGRRTTAGAAPQGGGGLGDLLGAVLGGAAVGGASGGLGGMLNKALTGKGKTLEEPDHAQELAAGLMLKVMIQAVKCDAELDDDEKKKLMDSLSDATQAEMKFVNAELAAPLDIDGLARQIPQGMEAQAYMMSLMAINLDNQNEAQYLHAFAQALELDKDQVNAIHDHVQAPRLYT